MRSGLQELSFVFLVSVPLCDLFHVSLAVPKAKKDCPLRPLFEAQSIHTLEQNLKFGECPI